MSKAVILDMLLSFYLFMDELIKKDSFDKSFNIFKLLRMMTFNIEKFINRPGQNNTTEFVSQALNYELFLVSK